MKFNSGNSPSTSQKTDTNIDYDQLKDMVETCMVHLAIFNGWEEKFLEDMTEAIDAKRPLSVRQREIIGNCYDKVERRRR